MHSTNYYNSFILVAPDCTLDNARRPEKPGTIAAMQYEMIVEQPYAHSSDDVIFTIFARRNSLDPSVWPEERARFFAKGQACLRASPLVKSFGFGIHHDGEGRVALYAMESASYAQFVANGAVKKVAGMRSKRE